MHVPRACNFREEVHESGCGGSDEVVATCMYDVVNIVARPWVLGIPCSFVGGEAGILTTVTVQLAYCQTYIENVEKLIRLQWPQPKVNVHVLFCCRIHLTMHGEHHDTSYRTAGAGGHRKSLLQMQ